MAKARIDVQLDKAEIGKIMKGKELSDFLLEIAQDVASKAGPEFEARISNARKSRVIAIALDPSPNARFKEMETGRLARALGDATR